MKLLKKLAPLSLLVLFVSCDGINLNLEANNTVTLKKNRVFKRDMTIYPGSYNATLSFSPNYANLKIAGVRGTAYFKIPGGIDSLPKNGTRVLHPSQTGQPLTTTFTSTYNEYRGNEVRTTESCTFTRRVPCYSYAWRVRNHMPNFNEHNCLNGYEVINVPGTRRVIYTPVSTVRTISVEAEGLEAEGTQKGSFRDYAIKGECRVRL